MAPTGSPVAGIADLGEEVEVAERVAGLALGDRAEQRRDVGVALDVGLLREVQVAAVRLALAGERFLQVVVGSTALELGHALLRLLRQLGQARSTRRSHCPRTCRCRDTETRS